MLSFWEKECFLDYDLLIIGGGIVGLSTACSWKEKNPEKSVLVPLKSWKVSLVCAQLREVRLKSLVKSSLLNLPPHLQNLVSDIYRLTASAWVHLASVLLPKTLPSHAGKRCQLLVL
jgi:hypothetical protein